MAWALSWESLRRLAGCPRGEHTASHASESRAARLAVAAELVCAVEALVQ